MVSLEEHAVRLINAHPTAAGICLHLRAMLKGWRRRVDAAVVQPMPSPVPVTWSSFRWPSYFLHRDPRTAENHDEFRSARTHRSRRR